MEVAGSIRLLEQMSVLDIQYLLIHLHSYPSFTNGEIEAQRS